MLALQPGGVDTALRELIDVVGERYPDGNPLADQ